MDQRAADADTLIISEFRDFLRDPQFPCVGAKSALSRRQIEFHVVASGEDHDREIVEKLQAFAREWGPDTLFASFITIFKDEAFNSETEFEDFLWKQLEKLHTIDRLSHDWDPKVSKDPESPEFSMSFGGRAFYIVGLHPQSSRKARQFKYPALVFNLHSQFEVLRSSGKYDVIHDSILERDVAFSGSTNPMLASFGTVSEARQYSGRKVDGHWKCPFHATKDNYDAK